MATGESKSKWTDHKSASYDPYELNNSSDIELAYQGKKAESEILSTQAASLISMWSGTSSDPSHNRLYYGDNLPILAGLLEDGAVRQKVRLIYIDPPYATNSVFRSRSDKDAYLDLLVGSQYLEFMRERLIIMRELLSDDGSIYVHLDGTMAFHVKVILDELFGRRNFRNCITRRKCNPKNYTRRAYGNISDYIFFYTKTDNYVWNRPFDDWTDESARKEYSYTEPDTGRRFKKVPIHAPGTRNGETGKPWRNMLPPKGKHWQFPPHKLDEMDAKGEIFWSSNGNPRRKIYLEHSQGIPIQDIWWDLRDAHNQNVKITGYPTEKNPQLLSRIIEASSNPDDLILDCFSGSGTTLEIASQLNRRWIGVDSSVEAIATTLKRFAVGRELMGDYVRKTNTRPEQLALNLVFDEIESITAPEQQTLDLPEDQTLRIKDFELFATKDRTSEIEQLVCKWNEDFHSSK